MSEDIEQLQRMMEQATAAEEASKDGLDPETASLRDAWIGFGQLLESPSVAWPLAASHALLTGNGSQEGANLPRSRNVPRSSRLYRWVMPAAGLLAASLLIGVLTTWTSREADLPQEPRGDNSQMAAIRLQTPTLVQQTQPAASTADELRWDDSLDERITQASQGMLYAQQPLNNSADLLAYGIGQMQQELAEDKF